MAKAIVSKPAVKAPAKMIPATVVIYEARERLKKIDKYLKAVDSVLAAIEESNDWAIALSFAIKATGIEADGLRNYLAQVVINADGAVVGIQEGGAL